ncbi:hypothetical protein ABIC33_003200 [Variovorax sp. 1140]|uniref:hypothetical protein n=1 Tax=Variovorax atrisoli TaxID=3394203 RepID=UPI003396973A
MRNVFTVAAAICVLSLVGCEQSPSYEVAMCSEPIRISDCKVENQMFPTCTIENAAQVALRGNMQTWSYDQSGMRLGSSVHLSTSGLMPGQKKRVELIADGGVGKMRKIVVCSMDPESPLMQGRVSSVGQAK